MVGPLGTAAFVVGMLIFMLLERRDLRDRLIGLFGHGRLTITTKAFDEAGTRVSRQLLMQSLVNLLYGIAAGIGLYFLGVPYALVWASLGAVLRFIPYVGPVLGAGAPILVSLAALDGWSRPLWVMGLFVVLELFTNLVLETVLYAGAMGVSQVALLVSLAFWTWLWGPLGLLMGTPLTVCLVVLGKHVPGMEFVGMLMADTPAACSRVWLLPALAGPRSKRGGRPHRAAHQKPEPAFGLRRSAAAGAQLCGTRSTGAAAVARRRSGRHRGDARAAVGGGGGDPEDRPSPTAPPEDSPSPAPREPLRVLGCAINGAADELALMMLANVVDDLSIVVETTSLRMQASELVSLVEAQGVSIVCLADLPPSPPSKTRYLVKRLHAALPDVRILVGRWGPAALADESTQPLRDAGASLVASTLAETRTYLGGLAEIARIPAPVTTEV